MDQVAKLGKHSKTNKAVDIFGSIGQQIQVPQIDTKVASSMATVAPGLGSRRPKKQSLLGLIMDDAFRRLIGIFNIVVDVLFGLGKGVLNVFTAHTILVTLLATSVLYNSWHSYRDGLVWYNERNAGKFMARIGVTPNPSMSKAIFLSDVETLITPSLDNDTLSAFSSSSDSTRTCRSTFSDHLTPSIAPSHQVSRRLTRTRGLTERVVEVMGPLLRHGEPTGRVTPAAGSAAHSAPGTRLDPLVARHLADTGSYPRSVGITVWGTAAMRTAGDDIGEAMALMGIRPVWDDASRRITGLEAVPLEELGRPRVDVTLRISGFFRDAFPHAVGLLDDAGLLLAHDGVELHWPDVVGY